MDEYILNMVHTVRLGLFKLFWQYKSLEILVLGS